MEDYVKKRAFFFVIGITVIALLFALGACPTDNGNTEPGPEVFPGNPTGRASGTAPGYHGDVTVEISMENGWITTVTVDGPEESPGIGLVAVQRAPDIIKAKNSVDIDVINGATLTTNAIKAAGQKAINEIIDAQ
jgi:fumarate reductase flavoprotein subunit